MKVKKKISNNINIILIGTLISAIYWIIESFIEYFILDLGNFYDRMIELNKHELIMRFTISVILMSFSIYGYFFIKKLRIKDKELSESENKYKILVDQASDGIVIYDRDGNLKEANIYFCDMLGYTHNEILKLNVRNVVSQDDINKIPLKIDEIMSGKTIIIERKLNCKNGTQIHVEVSSKLLGDGRLIAIHRNITQRKTMEKIVEETNNRYKRLADNSPDLIYVFSSVRGGLYYSPSVESILGYSISYLYQNPMLWHDSIHPDDLQVVDRAIKDFVSNKQPFELEYRIKDSQGNWHWFYDRSIGILTENGETIIEGLASDITNRKQTEIALKRSNRALKILSLCNSRMVLSSNEIDFMDAICRLIVEIGEYKLCWIGFAENDKEKSIHPITQSGFEEGYLHSIKISWRDNELGSGPSGTAIRSGNPVIAQNILTDPKFKPWREQAIKRGYASSIALPIINSANVLGVLNIYSSEPDAFDANEILLLMELADDLAFGITHIRANIEKELLEKELKESENRYRTLFESIPDAIISVDVETEQVVNANPAASKLFLKPLNEILGLHFTMLHPPEQREFSKKSFIEQANKKTHFQPVEEIVLRSDGTKVHVEILDAIVNVNGRQILQGVFRDITERRKAEEELAKSKAEWSYAMNYIEDTICLMDMDDKVVRINQSFTKLTGLTNEMSIGKDISSLIHPKEKNFLCPICKARKDRIDTNITMEADSPENPIGKPVEIIIRIIRNKNNDPIGVLMGIHDLTRQRQIEKELLKAQKLESIGILAGGIAHNFNNILTGVSGNIALAKMGISSEHEIYSNLLDAEEIIMQAKNVSQRLMTISRGENPVKKLDRISDLLINTVKYSLANSNIKYNFLISNDLWMLEFDSIQITQVINNIVVNSKEAMHDDGILEIKAENITNESESFLSQFVKWVKITIKDNGVGISKEHFKNIFDPYFTTKSNGNGLGLASSYSIISKHDGIINFDSTISEGTAFYIYLPVSNEK
ncbi:MAG: PAS domain S-box protein [Spirochaetota bacterium]|nr:PAS domain S-box protein [Spirochaetota bacterium]